MAKRPIQRENLAARFGIGEWYGDYIPQKTTNVSLLRQLAQQANHHRNDSYPCPFRDGSCNKKGGVCSLTLYQAQATDTLANPLSPPDRMRILCPNRFWQDQTVIQSIAQDLLSTSNPHLVKEIRFLRPVSQQPIDASDETTQESVGNIDLVLVNTENNRFDWCAVEFQAVYFSGPAMNSMFQEIEQSRAGLPFPDKIRRPDYRSSGPKRLMPQLQIKIPTLRRWGKKMAIVVDESFIESLGPLPETADVSNADLIWYVVDIKPPDSNTSEHGQLVVTRRINQTLERAVESLTAGQPVTQTDFENKIREKLSI